MGKGGRVGGWRGEHRKSTHSVGSKRPGDGLRLIARRVFRGIRTSGRSPRDSRSADDVRARRSRSPDRDRPAAAAAEGEEADLPCAERRSADAVRRLEILSPGEKRCRSPLRAALPGDRSWLPLRWPCRRREDAVSLATRVRQRICRERSESRKAATSALRASHSVFFFCMARWCRVRSDSMSA